LWWTVNLIIFNLYSSYCYSLYIFYYLYNCDWPSGYYFTIDTVVFGSQYVSLSSYTEVMDSQTIYLPIYRFVFVKQYIYLSNYKFVHLIQSLCFNIYRVVIACHYIYLSTYIVLKNIPSIHIIIYNVVFDSQYICMSNYTDVMVSDYVYFPILHLWMAISIFTCLIIQLWGDIQTIYFSIYRFVYGSQCIF